MKFLFLGLILVLSSGCVTAGNQFYEPWQTEESRLNDIRSQEKRTLAILQKGEKYENGQFVNDPDFWKRPPQPDAVIKTIGPGGTSQEVEIHAEYDDSY